MRLVILVGAKKQAGKYVQQISPPQNEYNFKPLRKNELKISVKKGKTEKKKVHNLPWGWELFSNFKVNLPQSRLNIWISDKEHLVPQIWAIFNVAFSISILTKA